MTVDPANGQSTASGANSGRGDSESGSARSANSDLSFQEKHDFIVGEIYAKQQWLAKFGSGKVAWPEHIIDQKQKALRMFEAIADDYKRAAERQRA